MDRLVHIACSVPDECHPFGAQQLLELLKGSVGSHWTPKMPVLFSGIALTVREGAVPERLKALFALLLTSFIRQPSEAKVAQQMILDFISEVPVTHCGQEAAGVFLALVKLVPVAMLSAAVVQAGRPDHTLCVNLTDIMAKRVADSVRSTPSFCWLLLTWLLGFLTAAHHF